LLSFKRSALRESFIHISFRIQPVRIIISLGVHLKNTR
jgi:hypothetical protein